MRSRRHSQLEHLQTAIEAIAVEYDQCLFASPLSSKKIQPLPDDVPSGLRSLYQRRKWEPPSLEATVFKKPTASQERHLAAQHRKSASIQKHNQKHSHKKSHPTKHRSAITTLDHFDTSSTNILEWSNPEGWSTWSDAPLFHPDVMPQRNESPQKMTPYKAEVDTKIQKWRLQSVLVHVQLRKISERLGNEGGASSTSSNREQQTFMKSSAPEFALVERLDSKLQSLDREIHDLSPYERQQTGLCRKQPLFSLFETKKNRVKKKKKKRRAKKKKKKIQHNAGNSVGTGNNIVIYNNNKMVDGTTTTTMKPLTALASSSQHDLSYTLHQRRKAREQKQKRNSVHVHRESVQSHRRLGITVEGLSKCQQLRRVFLDMVQVGVHADRAAFWVHDAVHQTLWTDNNNGSEKRITIHADSGLAGKCFLSGEAILVSDVYQNRLFNPKVDKGELCCVCVSVYVCNVFDGCIFFFLH